MKTYPLVKSPLFRLQSKKKLVNILGLQLSSLKLAELCKTASQRYETFDVTKKKKGVSKTRTINQPQGELKEVQKKLSRFLTRIETPSYLQSKRGCSYKDNALKHLGHEYVITLDIQDFFPSCTRERIAKSLAHHFEMSGDISYLLSQAMSFKGIVPQGSNTSTAIAFWSNRSMFDEISEYCLEVGLTFTLFVDDITVSSASPISMHHYNHIVCILMKNGFKVKYSKTKYFKPGQPKHITGIVLLGNLHDIEFEKKKIFFQKLAAKNRSAKENVSLIGRFNSLSYIRKDFCPSLRVPLMSANPKKRARKVFQARSA